MHRFIIAILLLSSVAVNGQSTKKASKAKGEYISVRVYHCSDQQQLHVIDQYLQLSLLPALEKQGFNRVGFFEAIDNDTARDKRMYVFIPFQSLPTWDIINAAAEKSVRDSITSAEYVMAPFNRPSYSRFETILLYTFEGRPAIKPSVFKGK